MTKLHGIDIAAYMKGEMVLHFKHITLTQRHADNPIVFSGPGQVHLDKGYLKYVVYHTCASDEVNRYQAMRSAAQAGKLVTENSLFDFEGIDITGKIWTAKGVDTSGAYHVEFCVIKGSIEFLSYRSEVPRKHQSTLLQVYFDHPHFPSSSLPIAPSLEFVCHKSSVTITKHESGCDVSVLAEDELNDQFAKAIQKTLNVLSGVCLQLGFTEKIWKGHSLVELYSRNIELSNQQLLPPVKIPLSCPSDFFGTVFNLLVVFFHQNGNLYYDNWHKLNRAWQAGIESAALNVSVCIEGVLKEYFAKYGIDSEFAEQCNQAVPAINELEIDERIKKFLTSCLRSTGNFKPKIALVALAKSNKITPTLPEKWPKLRNKTAHAVVTGETREDWQKTVDLTLANIKLFYELLFFLVGYTGERIDYESHGFPSGLPATKT